MIGDNAEQLWKQNWNCLLNSTRSESDAQADCCFVNGSAVALIVSLLQ